MRRWTDEAASMRLLMRFETLAPTFEGGHSFSCVRWLVVGGDMLVSMLLTDRSVVFVDV